MEFEMNGKIEIGNYRDKGRFYDDLKVSHD